MKMTSYSPRQSYVHWGFSRQSQMRVKWRELSTIVSEIPRRCTGLSNPQYVYTRACTVSDVPQSATVSHSRTQGPRWSWSVWITRHNYSNYQTGRKSALSASPQSLSVTFVMCSHDLLHLGFAQILARNMIVGLDPDLRHPIYTRLILTAFIQITTAQSR